jgi:multidrug resistance efflux pump
LKKDAGVDAANTLGKISSSYDALRLAERDLYYYKLPANQRNMDMFVASEMTKKNLDEARKKWNPFKYEDALYGNWGERQQLNKNLDDAESDYRTSLVRINYAAKAKTAQADLEKALKDYEQRKGGPDPEKLAAAEAKFKNAQAALESAKASLADLELRAPFSGKVAKLDAKVGENAQPGAALVTLADFSQMIIETDNLTEIEVVNVKEGQAITAVADALPEEEIKGTVYSIAPAFEEKRGDVTYTVKIALKEIPAQLRWGMTINCTFLNE